MVKASPKGSLNPPDATYQRLAQQGYGQTVNQNPYYPNGPSHVPMAVTQRPPETHSSTPNFMYFSGPSTDAANAGAHLAKDTGPENISDHDQLPNIPLEHININEYDQNVGTDKMEKATLQHGQIYHCRYCPHFTRRKHELIDHERKHSDKYNFGCHLCGFIPKQHSSIKNHYYKEHKMKFNIDLCRKLR